MSTLSNMIIFDNAKCLNFYFWRRKLNDWKFNMTKWQKLRTYPIYETVVQSITLLYFRGGNMEDNKKKCQILWILEALLEEVVMIQKYNGWLTDNKKIMYK